MAAKCYVGMFAEWNSRKKNTCTTVDKSNTTLYAAPIVVSLYVRSKCNYCSTVPFSFLEREREIDFALWYGLPGFCPTAPQPTEHRFSRTDGLESPTHANPHSQPTTSLS